MQHSTHSIYLCVPGSFHVTYVQSIHCLCCLFHSTETASPFTCMRRNLYVYIEFDFKTFSWRFIEEPVAFSSMHISVLGRRSYLLTSIVFVFVLVLDTADYAAWRSIFSAPSPSTPNCPAPQNYGYQERYETTAPLAGGPLKTTPSSRNNSNASRHYTVIPLLNPQNPQQQ